MSEFIVIRLPTQTTGPVQWLFADGAGGRLGIVMAGSLHDAAAMCVGRKIAVIVPAEQVLSLAKRGAKLEQMARYALEEHLAGDVEQLHVALGKRRSDGATPIAAVAHDLMAAWLADLAAAGIVPDALYSADDLLPIHDGYTLLVDGELLYSRYQDQPVASLDAQPLQEALQIALPPAPDAAPRTVTFYVTQADHERASDTLEQRREQLGDLQVKLLPEGPLPLWAQRVVQGQAVDLQNTALAPWRIAAVLVAAAVGLQIVTNGALWWRLSAAEKQADQQLRELVAQTLPGVDLRDARAQFQTRMNTLQGAGPTGLLRTLNVISGSLAPDSRLEALVYQPTEVNLRVTAPTVDELVRISQKATEQGIPAALESTAPRDNRHEGRIKLKPGGP
jgi:general secretion pathway protein L